MLGYLKSHLLFPLFEKHQKRDIRIKINILKNHYTLPRHEREKLMRKQLHHILRIAQEHVPYYRELFTSTGFNPEKVLQDATYLQELPFLNKDIIREQGNRLLNENYDHTQLHMRKTGGSTGPSVLIYYDQEALDWTAAVNLYVLEFTGRQHWNKEVHLSTNFHQKQPFRDRMRERMKCLAMNRVNVYTDAFDDESMKRLFIKLRRTRPYIIQGHPSTFYALARYVEKNQRKTKPIMQVIESTGESLDRKKLNTIEHMLNATVYNRFGNAEFGVIAHSREDPFSMEIIDYMVHAETFPIQNDHKEIVLTGLTNEAMPLIRYRTGDLGDLHDDGDRTFLISVRGRIHDIVRINNREYPTHYIQDVLDRAGGIEEFQVIQKRDGRITLKLVPSITIDRSMIERKVYELFGKSISIEYTNYEGLVRTGWREKFRYLVKEE